MVSHATKAAPKLHGRLSTDPKVNATRMRFRPFFGSYRLVGLDGMSEPVAKLLGHPNADLRDDDVIFLGRRVPIHVIHDFDKLQAKPWWPDAARDLYGSVSLNPFRQHCTELARLRAAALKGWGDINAVRHQAEGYWGRRKALAERVWRERRAYLGATNRADIHFGLLKE